LSAKIRLASTADLPAIVAIYNATIPTRQSNRGPRAGQRGLASFLARAPRPQAAALLGARRRRSGGCVVEPRELQGARRVLRHCEVSVYVDLAQRRKGYARTLLAHAIDRAPSLGLERLVAVVFGHNEASVALFERAGFARWGCFRVSRAWMAWRPTSSYSGWP